MRSRRPRRSSRSYRSRSSSRGMGPAIVLAALALAGVMGVTVLSGRGPRKKRAAPVYVPELTADTVIERPAPAPKPHTLVGDVEQTIRDTEKAMPALRRRSRGPGFEEARVELLAQVSEAREKLGLYLDEHGEDDGAQALWDRVVRLYVALTKL